MSKLLKKANNTFDELNSLFILQIKKKKKKQKAKQKK
jgi:hypothetical protein